MLLLLSMRYTALKVTAAHRHWIWYISVCRGSQSVPTSTSIFAAAATETAILAYSDSVGGYRCRFYVELTVKAKVEEEERSACKTQKFLTWSV